MDPASRGGNEMDNASGMSSPDGYMVRSSVSYACLSNNLQQFNSKSSPGLRESFAMNSKLTQITQLNVGGLSFRVELFETDGYERNC